MSVFVNARMKAEHKIDLRLIFLASCKFFSDLIFFLKIIKFLMNIGEWNKF